jgi:hypothetical protein
VSFRNRPGAAGAPTPTAIVLVSPIVGAAGETIRVYCTRLRAGATLAFGGNAVTITAARYGSWNAEEVYPYVEGALPAHADGAVVVVVGNYHDTAEDAFTYAAGGNGDEPEYNAATDDLLWDEGFDGLADIDDLIDAYSLDPDAVQGLNDEDGIWDDEST